jgi:microcystin-dependent protein
MAGTTTRLQLPYPVPADNVDVPRDVKALTDRLDPIAAVFAAGAVGARPAAGTAGRFYFATDTSILYFDTGSAWVALNADPIPIGLVVPFAGTAAPSTQWLLCDGSAVSRTTYAALFALAGTAFNIGGEAGTDFRLPDLRGRAVIGAGQGSGLTNRALGARVGEENHTLTITEIPSHNHGGGAHNHTLVGGGNLVSDAGTPWAYVTGPAGAAAGVGLNTILSSPAIIAANGGGGSHNVMQPSVTLGAIVKAL